VPFLQERAVSTSAGFFVPFGVVVITGASNSVNLTDGLDGLAIGAGNDRGPAPSPSSATSSAMRYTPITLQLHHVAARPTS